MADAGNKQGVIDIRCDRIAPAVDKHRGNRAAIAGKDGANERVDRVAHPLHEGVCPRQRSFRVWRSDHFDPAARKPRGANALEKQVAGKVIATRFTAQ
jgi:hypothetical protein